MTRRMTLALRVFGRSRTNLTSRGASGLPSASRDARLQLGPQRVVRRMTGFEHAEADERLALESIGHADGRGFAHGRMRDENRFDLGRAEPFAGDFDRVVAAAEDVPQAVAHRRRPSRRAPRCPGKRDQ